MQQLTKRTLFAVFLSAVLVIGSAVLVNLVFLGYHAFSAARETKKLHQVHPSPDHSPAEVVRFQLAALSQVDKPHPGAGLELVYAFLAPDQRDTMGDLDQLAALFAKPPYQDLVGFHSVKLDEARVAGNHAQQLALVLTPDNRLAAFAFLLTRQEEGEFAGSWMTVAVLPMNLEVSAGALPQTDPGAATLPSPAE